MVSASYSQGPSLTGAVKAIVRVMIGSGFSVRVTGRGYGGPWLWRTTIVRNC